MWMPLTCPQLGIWPTTQACTLAGNEPVTSVQEAGTQSTEPHQPELFFFLIINIIPTLLELSEKSFVDRTSNMLTAYKKEKWYHSLNTCRAGPALSLSVVCVGGECSPTFPSYSQLQTRWGEERKARIACLPAPGKGWLFNVSQ